VHFNFVRCGIGPIVLTLTLVVKINRHILSSSAFDASVVSVSEFPLSGLLLFRIPQPLISNLILLGLPLNCYQ